MIHAREQYTVVSRCTANTEREEAIFRDIKIYPNKIRNHQPESIISNAIIRYQTIKRLESVT